MVKNKSKNRKIEVIIDMENNKLNAEYVTIDIPEPYDLHIRKAGNKTSTNIGKIVEFEFYDDSMVASNVDNANEFYDLMIYAFPDIKIEQYHGINTTGATEAALNPYVRIVFRKKYYNVHTI